MIRRTIMAVAALWLAGGPVHAQAPLEEPAAAETPAKGPAPKRNEPRAAKAPPKGGTKPRPSTPMAIQPDVPPPNLTVLCEGKPARYAAGSGAAIWVLRSGAATVENPLRPLTPDVTRVLEVIVGDRRATAFGPDLSGLRRGGVPAALGATLGAQIRWDEALTLLPDTLVIVSEAGETLARIPFRECSEAPAVKPDPVKPAPKAGARPEAKAAPKPRRPAASAEPTAPKGLNIPQGAISAPPEGRP
ncbi:hypothetical protein [Methylobacterium sp.]|uniref:hypothetical protein n=1 Tax=Methylobacterium sp. TaxID=409 RepID=UPI0025EEAAFE|nr:hypothetical protein [Methylobacterium sp.]